MRTGECELRTQVSDETAERIRTAAAASGSSVADWIKHACMQQLTFEEGPRRDPERTNALREYLMMPIDRLTLPLRLRAVLDTYGVKTIGDVLKLSESELLRAKNLGRKSLDELRVQLSEMGLSLRIKRAPVPVTTPQKKP